MRKTLLALLTLAPLSAHATPADDAYAKARGNALFAHRDDALVALQELAKLGTPDVIDTLERARTDITFMSLFGNARFRELTHVRHWDVQQTFMQICQNSARFLELVDPTVGFVSHWQTENTPDGGKAKTSTKLVKGEAATKAASDYVQGMVSVLCGESHEEDMPLVELSLARQTAPEAALGYDMLVEWSSQSEVTFARDGDDWRVAAIAEWPSGPIDEEVAGKWREDAARASQQGLDLYPHRASGFRRGDPAAAKTFNEAGLKARKKDDHAAALAAYEQAVAASPIATAARYNLACELALAGKKAEAVAQLEALVKIATGEALTFLKAAPTDADFASLVGDPGFAAVVATVQYDPTQSFAQVCKTPTRIVGLVDPKLGYVDHIELEPSPDGPGSITSRVVKGAEALNTAIAHMNELAYSMCGEYVEEEQTLLTQKLADATGEVVSLGYSTGMEWSLQNVFTFAKTKDGWRIATLASWPTGPIDADVQAQYDKRGAAAAKKGAALFNLRLAP